MTNLYTAVMGSAGVGKSWTINNRLKEDPSYCLRTATTGIAAVNMGEGAITINSALGYYTTTNLLQKVVSNKVFPRLEEISKRYKNISIDEISMLSSGDLDLIYMSVQAYNQKSKKKLGLVLTGDSGQLPAVAGNPFFQAKCWNKFSVEYLTEVKRQSDREFIEALSFLRKGKVEEVVDWFDANVGFNSKVDPNFQGSTFFSENVDVNQYNYTILNTLQGKSRKYFTVIKGTSSSVWKNIPQYVELKVGALVMILINGFNEGYANGDQGYVEEMHDNTVLVKLIRTGRRVFIKPITMKYTPIGYVTAQGSITYLPLRIAYGSTIHKSQSLTLDAVQIKLNSEFLSRLSGGLYTAVSRVRTKEGLRLVGTKEDFINACYLDPRYVQFIH